VDPTLFEELTWRLGIAPVVLDLVQLMACLLAAVLLLRSVRKRAGARQRHWLTPMVLSAAILGTRYVRRHAGAGPTQLMSAPAAAEVSVPIIGSWNVDSSGNVRSGAMVSASPPLTPTTWAFEPGGVFKASGGINAEGVYSFRDTVVTITAMGGTTLWRIVDRADRTLVLEQTFTATLGSRTHLTRQP
jgi:hypothetical protein